MGNTKSPLALTFLLAFSLSIELSTAFVQPRSTSSQVQFSSRLTAKGFGGSGFAAKKPSAKKVNKKDLLRRVEKKYGGTSPQDIARGTQKQIESAMKALPPHLQMATQLYQQLQKWNAHVNSMTVLDQTRIPTQELEGAKRAEQELERLYKEHNFSEADLHNIFQKITWDASADAKAANAVAGQMPKDIADRVDKACSYVAEAVKSSNSGRCLDVGCGFGVLVPALEKAGVERSQITGIDLSEEMIRNAQELYSGVEFQACDFLQNFEDDDKFDSVIFCASLHDLPDPVSALEKATALLREQGTLVIVHPQGAAHVLSQANSNPVMVKRGLPDAEELKSLGLGLDLLVPPAAPRSREEEQNGYLAVLKR